MDRLFEWDSKPNTAIREALERQKDHVKKEFESTLARSVLNLNEQGLNVALYWKNPDPRKYVNIVPTSAISGEGIPDMLQLVVQLTQVSFWCLKIIQITMTIISVRRRLKGCYTWIFFADSDIEIPPFLPDSSPKGPAWLVHSVHSFCKAAFISVGHLSKMQAGCKDMR